MYYLIDVVHNDKAVHLSRNDLKGFKKGCITTAMDGTDCDMMWNGSEEDGKVRS